MAGAGADQADLKTSLSAKLDDKQEVSSFDLPPKPPAERELSQEVLRYLDERYASGNVVPGPGPGKPKDPFSGGPVAQLPLSRSVSPDEKLLALELPPFLSDVRRARSLIAHAQLFAAYSLQSAADIHALEGSTVAAYTAKVRATVAAGHEPLAVAQALAENIVDDDEVSTVDILKHLLVTEFSRDYGNKSVRGAFQAAGQAGATLLALERATILKAANPSASSALKEAILARARASESQEGLFDDAAAIHDTVDVAHSFGAFKALGKKPNPKPKSGGAKSGGANNNKSNNNRRAGPKGRGGKSGGKTNNSKGKSDDKAPPPKDTGKGGKQEAES